MRCNSAFIWRMKEYDQGYVCTLVIARVNYRDRTSIVCLTGMNSATVTSLDQRRLPQWSAMILAGVIKHYR